MKCNVCGHEFAPKKENRYVSEERTAGFFQVTKYYDCFDCPECGCQIVAQERLATTPECVETGQDEQKEP